MKKYKLFIVEDDREALERLLALLKEYDKVVDFERIVTASSFLEAQQVMAIGEIFDISILDKYLDEGETCFSLVTKNNKHRFGLLVLNTLEPNDQQTLVELQIAGGWIVLGKPYTKKGVADLISKLPEKGKEASHANKILSLAYPDRTILIRHKDVVYVETDQNRRNYCLLHYFKNGKLESYSEKNTLKHFEAILDPTLFVRVHDSYIINCSPEMVENIKPGSVELTPIQPDGKKIIIPVSSSYSKLLHARNGG